MISKDKESTLSRWSRRKLEAQQAVESDASAAPASEPEATPESVAEKPVLTDADMPDLDSLTEDSDYSGFMSEGVSDELRKLALRKLFRSSVFNVRDGLDEYDDDFTQFEKLGDVVTSDMKHRMEIEAQKLREKLAAEAESLETEAETIEDANDGEQIAQAEDSKTGNQIKEEKHEQG